jgi:ribosomal protein S18 acetylase RimI-like enzyme
MPHSSLSFCQVRPEHASALARFFAELAASGDDRWFHPHPFTAEAAARIANYRQQDLYCIALGDDEVLAYGMLRGWEEGYEVPSLGIAVARAARGTGLARSFMHYLHSCARVRGSRSIRLKVYPENLRAKRLYESLGYQFATAQAGQLVGTHVLEAAA